VIAMAWFGGRAMTARRVERGLFGLAWLALAVAFLGVYSMPQHYCVELAVPVGQDVLLVGLAVAAGCVMAAVGVTSFRSDSLRDGLVAFGVAAIVLAAGLSIVAYASHQTASWSCG
jgi:hypothetical protein